MTRLYLGVDTSSYTTSVSCVSDEGIVFEQRTVLSVPLGARGLRQSEALFQHVKNLPSLMGTMLATVDRRAVAAVAFSAKPTAAEASYMPVFLAGALAAKTAAASLGVSFFEATHQAGHVRAAMMGNERMLPERAFLALHLSGGTTDVLSVQREPGGRLGAIECLGAGSDLHAGQFVDRVGVALGLPFPSGPNLETLATGAVKREIKLPASVRGLTCSFSGQETQALRLLESGAAKAEIAYAVYDCLARTIEKLLRTAVERTGIDAALLSGGVSGSPLLRRLIGERLKMRLFYAPPGLSSDNAVGVALLAKDFYSDKG